MIPHIRLYAIRSVDEDPFPFVSHLILWAQPYEFRFFSDTNIVCSIIWPSIIQANTAVFPFPYKFDNRQDNSLGECTSSATYPKIIMSCDAKFLFLWSEFQHPLNWANISVYLFLILTWILLILLRTYFPYIYHF